MRDIVALGICQCQSLPWRVLSPSHCLAQKHYDVNVECSPFEQVFELMYIQDMSVISINHISCIHVAPSILFKVRLYC